MSTVRHVRAAASQFENPANSAEWGGRMRGVRLRAKVPITSSEKVARGASSGKFSHTVHTCSGGVEGGLVDGSLQDFESVSGSGCSAAAALDVGRSETYNWGRLASDWARPVPLGETVATDTVGRKAMTETIQSLAQHQLVILRRLRRGPLTEFELVNEVAEHSGYSGEEAADKMADWLETLRAEGLVWAGALSNADGQTLAAAALTTAGRELVN